MLTTLCFLVVGLVHITVIREVAHRNFRMQTTANTELLQRRLDYVIRVQQRQLGMGCYQYTVKTPATDIRCN